VATQKKKGCLGCSLPVAIILTVVVLALVILGILAGPLGRAFNISGLPHWMTLEQPAPRLAADVVFHIFGFPVTNTILATWITMLVLIILAVIAARRLKLIPGRLQSMWENTLNWIYELCINTAGEKNGRTFFPLVATIFLFVGLNAWLSLIPGYGTITVKTAEGTVEFLRGANTDLNTTLSLAIVVFLTAEFMGFKRFKLGYLRKFFVARPVARSFMQLFKKGNKGEAAMGMVSGLMTAFAGILELLSEFIRIISLTFRLFGNMLAGEILLLMIAFLVPYFLPIIFYGLEGLVGFIQALVFSALTIVYISLAVTPHHDEGEHKKEPVEAPGNAQEALAH
jgi:F-type H+-transporting ATPase subunit a